MRLSIFTILIGILLAALSGLLISTRSATRLDTLLIQVNYNDLYTMRADGSERRKLNTEAVRVRDAQWSPDAHYIALTQSIQHIIDSNVYLMHADGSGLQQITDNESLSTYGTLAWSSDNRYLAFARSDTGARYSILAYDRRKHVLLELVSPADGFYRPQQPGIVWSPNNKSLVFTAGGHGRSAMLYKIADIAQPTVRPFKLSWLEGGQIQRPSFSPNGEWLAFSVQDKRIAALYATNVVDQTWQHLSQDHHFSEVTSSLMWSPDGHSIAFSAKIGDNNSDIYVADLNGNLTQLTHNPFDDLDPTWSTDGQTISFASFRDGNIDIYRIKAADPDEVIQLTFGSEFDSEPRWSPNQDPPFSAWPWLVIGFTLQVIGIYRLKQRSHHV